jgi:hypothetical protein
MSHILKLALTAPVFCIAALILDAPPPLAAGQASLYKVLDPITEGNLTLFPVVTTATRDTSGFLTLDEGMRTGEVVITEAGRAGLIRPRHRRGEIDPGFIVAPQGGGAEVNRLVLLNRSDRPLILLAGEIVTGGKQDRVVAKDRIVPPKSEPIDLSVFCVEPHRWTTVGDFATQGAPIAQPSVRRKVMVQRDQEAVWASVGAVQGRMVAAAPAPAAAELRATSSYATVMANGAVQEKLRDLTAPIERSYGKLERQLRAEKALGVVAAVNGRIVWADIFASPDLFNLYWPKLVQSYAAEAITTPSGLGRADLKSAQAFLDNWNGCRDHSESEDAVYRFSEISGERFTAFRLISLLPHTGFDVHDAKMAEDQIAVCAE